MQSHASETTPASASALHKRRNGEENNVPPSPVSRTGNARSRRALALIGGAHDAAAAQPQQTSEVSAEEHAKLLDDLAAFAAAQPTALRLDEARSPRRAPPAHALASICALPPREFVVERLDDASKLSERAARFRQRLLAQGGDPDEDAYASATAKKRSRILVGAAAYVPHERPSQALTGATYPKKPEDWVHYEHDDQIDHDREALMKINMGGGRSGLDVMIGAGNKIGRLYFNKFDLMVAEKVCSPMRAGALTKTSTTTLSCKALSIDLYERKREEGAHVAVFRQIGEILRTELGVVAGKSGRVVGLLSTFGVEGVYHGYDATDEGRHVTKMTEASSALHKSLILAATTGRIDPVIKEGVNCSFGLRTMESEEEGGKATAARGNFTSHKRDGVPLPRAFIDARALRFAMHARLTAGRLSTTTWGFVGVSGAETNRAAEASGGVEIAFFSLADYDASELSLDGITSKRAQPIKPAAAAVAAFQDTLATCSEKQPHLYALYEALTRLGVTEEPNTNRTADKCLRKPFNAMSKWASAESALTSAFSVGVGDGAKLLCTTKDFESIQEWEKDWSCTRELLAFAGVGSLSELVHVSGDASGGAVIGQCRPHYVPKDTTMLDAHGERVHKPKRAKVGTGNGPTRYACHRCGHAWNPDPDAINQGSRKGQAPCKCGAWVKPPNP